MEFNQYGIQNLWKLNGNEIISIGEIKGSNIGSMTYVLDHLADIKTQNLNQEQKLQLYKIEFIFNLNRT